MTAPGPGVAPCPDCGERVLLALGDDLELLSVEPDDDGPLAACVDEAGDAHVRPLPPGGQLRLGEYLFALHACPLAKVLPFSGRARQDRPEKRRRYA
jgi:hypothetical protein